MNAVYPEADVANAWKTLSKHTVTVTKGWTESYGAFLKGEGDVVLSVNTSPIYHILSEQKTIMWQRNLQRVVYYKLKSRQSR